MIFESLPALKSKSEISPLSWAEAMRLRFGWHSIRLI